MTKPLASAVNQVDWQEREGPGTSERSTQTEAPVDCKLMYRDAAVILANLDHICIAIWTGEVRDPSFTKQRDVLAATVSQFPGQAAFLCVVEEKVPPPEDAYRRRSTRMITSHGERLACVACVIEGNGFRAAATRSVLSGMSLVARRHQPAKFTESADFAIDWMGKYTSVPAKDLLLTQLSQLREPTSSSDPA